MKRAFMVLLLLAPGAALADTAVGVWNPHAAAFLLHAHPHAWQPPTLSGAKVAGMTMTPETGEARMPTAADVRSAAAYRAALANIPVELRADGSRFARLGGLVRAYMVARVTPDGRLVRECVDSAPQAMERLQTAPSAANRAHEVCEEP